MLFLAAAVITISSSFPGGSIGRVEPVTPTHLRCSVKGQADQNHRNRQANWYYFRMDRLPRAEVTLDFTDLVGEYNFRLGAHAVTKNTRPVFSYDNLTWTHFSDDEVSWDERKVELTLRFTPKRSTMWIAHMAPYGKAELGRLLALHSPYLKQSSVGKTFRGRDIPLLTVTDASVPDTNKRVVWLMARQHAWEAGTSFVADGAVRFLLSSDPEAAQIRRSTIFQIIPLFDIDGVNEGAVRFNVNGYDNNRNWDVTDEKTMPEIASVRQSIESWLAAGKRIDLFLAVHDTESADYVDGPSRNPKIQPVATELVNRLRETTNFYDPQSPRDTTPASIDPSRYTAAQYLYGRHGVPAFLMELMVERHPRTGHPRTADEFVAFGAGLARSLAAAAQR